MKVIWWRGSLRTCAAEQHPLTPACTKVHVSNGTPAPGTRFTSLVDGFDPGGRPGLVRFRYPGWLGALRVEVTKTSADAGRDEPAGCGGAFPWAAQVVGEVAGEAKLGVGDDDQPRVGPSGAAPAKDDLVSPAPCRKLPHEPVLLLPEGLADDVSVPEICQREPGVDPLSGWREAIPTSRRNRFPRTVDLPCRTSHPRTGPWLEAPYPRVERVSNGFSQEEGMVPAPADASAATTGRPHRRGIPGPGVVGSSPRPARWRSPWPSSQRSRSPAAAPVRPVFCLPPRSGTIT
jgi:hypothetical protein